MNAHSPRIAPEPRARIGPNVVRRRSERHFIAFQRQRILLEIARLLRPAARRINAALARPFRLEAAEVCISASIGVALAGDGATADGLLMDADAAMYSAKEQGRGRSEVFGAAPSAP